MPIIQLLERDNTQIIYGLSLRERLSEAVNHILLVDEMSNHGLLLSIVAMLIVVILTTVTGEVDIPISPIPLILGVGIFFIAMGLFVVKPLVQAFRQNRIILNIKAGTIAIDKKGILTVYTPSQVKRMRTGDGYIIVNTTDENFYKITTYDEDLMDTIQSDLLSILSDVPVESSIIQNMAD